MDVPSLLTSDLIWICQLIRILVIWYSTSPITAVYLAPM